jgi:hypothetical protein
METKELVVLVILLALVALSVVYLVYAVQSYNECMTTESNACPTYVCGYNTSTTDPSCVSNNIAYPPYRKDNNGNIVCQPTGIAPAVPIT